MKEKISMQLLLASYMHIPEPMAEPILKDHPQENGKSSLLSSPSPKKYCRFKRSMRAREETERGSWGRTHGGRREGER